MIQRVLIFLKGLAMGAADVVPGVSGGTIAFITGIYDDLLSSINSVNLETLRVLRKEGIAAAWKRINGAFLLPLVAGIMTSFLTLAAVFKQVLKEHPHLLWGFFFGLIVASIFLVWGMVRKWDIIAIIGVIVGAVISYMLTEMKPGSDVNALWFVFISGSIAICAMILPGISGSFILLLLGVYPSMLAAVSELDLVFIAVLGSGAIVGLLSFSRLLKWTLDNYYDVTVAILTGFLIGSLNKIWPWKRTLEYRLDRHGESVPFIQENISPLEYPDPQVVVVVALALLGVGLLFALSKFKPKDA